MTEECDNCGNEVSNDYFRVFNVDGVLYGCLECQNIYGTHGPFSESDVDADVA